MSRIFKRSLFGTAGVAAAAAIAVLFVPNRWLSAFSRNEASIAEVTLAPRSMSFWVEATGTLKATSLQSYGGPPAFGNYWQFQIVSMIPEGQTVHKGDLLLTFDAQRVRDDLQRFQNEYNQAAKELEKTTVQIDLEREILSARLAEAQNKFEKLKLKQSDAGNVVASGTIESDRLALEQARREVSALQERIEWQKKTSEATYKVIASKQARAQNKVAEIQHGLENFQVKADRDGVVIYNLKWNGERFQVGETVWSAQPVLEIPDLNTIIAEALVPEVDIGRVKAGQRVEVTIDAFPGKSYSGTVRSIGKLVRQKAWDIQNKILDVQVALDHLETSVMRPGMSIKAKIEAASVANALAIPLKAVRVTAEGAEVKVRTSAGWTNRKVKLGDSNGTDVIVTDGLQPGEHVSADFMKAK